MPAAPRAWLLALAALLLAHPARGLGLLADDRSVALHVTPGCCDELFEAEFFAPFQVPGQGSEIALTPDGLGFDGTATGQANGFSDDANNFYDRTSIFSIEFRIDGAGSISLDGCFESSFDAAPGASSVQLLAGEQVLFSRSRDPFEPCIDEQFAFGGQLAPGTYTLEARAASVGVDSGVRFDLAFSVRDSERPVPEAPTLVALGLGLTGIGAMGRRRKEAGSRPR
ncbi:MAG: hypothetical protein DCC71_13415 [Proteobacteria bacterium]|nr:MAG: hypothetical protein DCC71_13415 [Pseudomonadota bacterium]